METLDEFLLKLAKECENESPVKAQDLRLAAYELKDLRHGLEQSLKLQSHYAELLNQYDGGKRMVFTIDSWISRIKIHPS